MQVVNQHTSNLLQQTTVIFRLLRQKKEYAFIQQKAETAYTELAACYGPSNGHLKSIESIKTFSQFKRFLFSFQNSKHYSNYSVSNIITSTTNNNNTHDNNFENNNNNNNNFDNIIHNQSPINESTYSDSPNIFLEDPNTSQGSHEDAVLVIVFCRLLANQLIHIHGKLEEALHFWRENLQTHPIVLFLQKTPLYWIQKIHRRLRASQPSKTVTEEEQDKLRVIKREMDYIASVVGTLVRTMDFISTSASSSHVAIDELLDLFENDLFHLFDVRLHDKVPMHANSGDPIIRRQRLETVFSHAEHILDDSKSSVSQYQPTGRLNRWWLLWGAGTVLTGFGVWYLTKNWDRVLQQSKETIFSLKRFSDEHILDPVRNIYSVIRYDEAKHRLVDPISINVAKQSLERMVTDLILDRDPEVNHETLNDIRNQVQHGNLSVVMDRYANAIRRPFYEAIFGDLARLILIQVQKQKVDIDRTMQSMDKLMKSNELNFEIMAMIPGILALVFATYQIFFFRRQQESILHKKLRVMLLESERILNRNRNSNDILDLQSQGQITILGANMTRIATELRNHRMLEDINEIVSEELSANQRLDSAQRMFKEYFIPSTIYKN